MTERTFSFSVLSTLPTALETFAAGVPAGTVSQFPSPTLNAMQANGSRPWDTTYFNAVIDTDPAWGADFLLDWGHMMDRDPTSKRYYASGGRPSTTDPRSHKSLKLVTYDEAENTWSSRDEWAANAYAGHLYRSTTVMTGPRLVAYHPNNAAPSGLKVFTWDIANGVEGPEIPIPPNNLGGTGSYAGGKFLCWFPTMGAEGSLIIVDPTSWRCYRFDWAGRAAGQANWTALTPGNFSSMPSLSGQSHINGHYHPVVDKMLAGNSYPVGGYSPTKLLMISADGTVALTRNVCPVPFASDGQEGGPTFPHSTLPLSILFCRTDNHIWTFDWRIEASGSGEPWVDRGLMPAELRSNYTIALPHPSGSGALFAKYGAAGTSEAWYWKEPSSWT